jgi:ferrous iron transport protein A
MRKPNAGKSTTENEVRVLTDLHPGEGGTVTALLGGREARRKLMDLGFVLGAEVKVIQGSRGTPYLVEVGKDGKIMVGRGMAEKVRVAG